MAGLNPNMRVTKGAGSSLQSAADLLVPFRFIAGAATVVDCSIQKGEAVELNFKVGSEPCNFKADIVDIYATMLAFGSFAMYPFGSKRDAVTRKAKTADMRGQAMRELSRTSVSLIKDVSKPAHNESQRRAIYSQKFDERVQEAKRLAVTFGPLASTEFYTVLSTILNRQELATFVPAPVSISAWSTYMGVMTLGMLNEPYESHWVRAKEKAIKKAADDYLTAQYAHNRKAFDEHARTVGTAIAVPCPLPNLPLSALNVHGGTASTVRGYLDAAAEWISFGVADDDFSASDVIGKAADGMELLMGDLPKAGTLVKSLSTLITLFSSTDSSLDANQFWLAMAHLCTSTFRTATERKVAFAVATIYAQCHLYNLKTTSEGMLFASTWARIDRGILFTQTLSVLFDRGQLANVVRLKQNSL